MTWPPPSFTLDSGVWMVVDSVKGGTVGDVFRVAHSETGEIAAIKAVAVESGDRDLLAAKLHLDGVRNIVPIQESKSADGMSLYRMPWAEASLRDFMEAAPGTCAEDDVLEVLEHIITALVDMGSRVFHRDIKPENVLRLDKRWCVADFGVARDQAVATATATFNQAAMNAYTAPERWNLDKGTSASDVYSLGTVAYEMLTGARPFPGPQLADFKLQHTTHSVPPLPVSTSVQLATLVTQMLGKLPGLRPSAQHMLDTLARIRDETPTLSAGAAALSMINLTAVRAREEHAATEAIHHRADQQRRELSKPALEDLDQIGTALKDAIFAAASEADHPAGSPSNWSTGLLGTSLKFELTEDYIPLHRTSELPFDVVATAEISLRLRPAALTGNTFRGTGDFSHSLRYCDPWPGGAGSFGWYETAFATKSVGKVPGLSIPYAQTVTTQAIDAFCDPLGNAVVCAWPLEILEPGALHGFIDRWLRWFADATQDELPLEAHSAVDAGWRTIP